ncbi:MAG: TIGR00159 family protein [Candidatus Eremiobacteraeota bacterium]|nr:TIGR00159 family protein [Candidatus Eremiobacteraeota bacterium]MBC5820862.1 TIGR00159 family protein [Candidatus Eremiobacteraeota bacterium]
MKLPHVPVAGYPFGISDAVDILATALLVYYLLVLMRGTRAVPILFGIVVLAGLLGLANIFHLLLLATILQYALLGTAVTLPIVFQPELRRLLEGLGRGGMFARRERVDESAALEEALAVLARAAVVLSRDRIGALVAIEGATGLREFVESGTRLDAKLSVELLLSIFTPRSPLHDGAAIVRGSLVEAAGCFLPLSENVLTESHLGTRHRAAIGLSEQTDAVVLVISEQTGAISIARTGKLSRELEDEKRLRSVLAACCRASRRRPGKMAVSAGFARRLRRRFVHRKTDGFARRA